MWLEFFKIFAQLHRYWHFVKSLGLTLTRFLLRLKNGLISINGPRCKSEPTLFNPTLKVEKINVFTDLLFKDH